MIGALRTERLGLAPIAPTDAPALHALWTDARVRRFLWDGEVVPLERTEAISAASARLFAERGVGLFGVREHGSDELVGFAGFWHFRAPPTLELVFGVAADRWSRGIATEAARCVVDYGFEVLGLPSIEASTDAANTASVRVLEKLGMSFRARAVAAGVDTLFYALDRARWRAR